MTVGRHRPRSSPRGDSLSSCDICGSLWYFSKLVRKRDGLLYCPDDVRGLDSVTLAEANARDAAKVMYSQRGHETGRIDNSNAPTKKMPTGILVDGPLQVSAITGWWSPRDVRGGSAVSNMDNIVRVSNQNKRRGDLSQSDSCSKPAYDGDVTVRYGGTAYLYGNGYEVLPVGTTSASFWCVAGAENPGASTNYFFHLTDVGAFATYEITPSGTALAHGVSLRVENGSLIGTWDNAVDGKVTVTAPFSDHGLHLFELRVTPTHLRLYLDNVQVGSTTFVTSASSAYPLYYTITGGGVVGGLQDSTTAVSSMLGRMNELIVYPADVTAAQAADIHAYYQLTYVGSTGDVSSTGTGSTPSPMLAIAPDAHWYYFDPSDSNSINPNSDPCLPSDPYVSGDTFQLGNLFADKPGKATGGSTAASYPVISTSLNGLDCVVVTDATQLFGCGFGLPGENVLSLRTALGYPADVPFTVCGVYQFTTTPTEAPGGNPQGIDPFFTINGLDTDDTTHRWFNSRVATLNGNTDLIVSYEQDVATRAADAGDKISGANSSSAFAFVMTIREGSTGYMRSDTWVNDVDLGNEDVYIQDETMLQQTGELMWNGYQNEAGTLSVSPSMKIGEIAGWTRVLTDVEIGEVFDHLMPKWGIS